MNRPVTVGMALIAVFVMGIIGTLRLPLAFLPSSQEAEIGVRVNVTRTSPAILEREIIRPLEEVLAGVRDLSELRMSSGGWGARASINFRPGTDIDARMLEVRERVERVRPDFPDLVRSVEISADEGEDAEPVMSIVLASEAPLQERYYELQRLVTRPLERIPGVARVELVGVEPHELEIALDVDEANRMGVSLSEVRDSVRTANRARGLGALERGDDRAQLRSAGVKAQPDTFRRLPVKLTTAPPASDAAPGVEADALEADAAASDPLATTPDGAAAPDATTGDPVPPRSLQLREVADVSLHPVEQRRGRRLNGQAAISVAVYATSGASVVEVTRAVREAVPALTAQPELAGIRFEIFEDEGEQIVKTLRDLRNSGIFGGLIGGVMLLLFLRRLRTTVVAAACIPLSVLAATGVLFFRGEELNCVVMLGLVLGVGIFIDNAVVIVESIQARAQEGMSRAQAARVGARQVGLATIASTLSSAIVFLPLMSDDPANPMTAYLRPLGVTFVIALIASLFVSQTVIPLLMSSGSGPLRSQKSPAMNWLRDRYGRLVTASLRRPRLTLLVGLLLAASSAYPLTESKFDLGEMQEETRSVPVSLEILGKSGYRRVIGHLEVVERALLARKDELGIRSVWCDYRDWWGRCSVYPATTFQDEQAVEGFKTTIQRALPEQAGIKYRVGESRRWYRQRSSAQKVRFVLKGDDMDTLFRLSTKVADALRAGLPAADPDDPERFGVERIVTPYDEGQSELHLRLDVERLAALGLRPSQVAQQVSSGFEGISLGRAAGPDGEISMRLSSLADRREPSYGDLLNLVIETPEGVRLPLRTLATFETARSPYWIQRIDRQTQARMEVHFVGGDMASNKRAVFEILDGVSLPPGYATGDARPWWRERENRDEMIINLGLCLLLVYAVMASLFESFLQPIAIMLTCLLGCFGAPWAMMASDTTIDTVALIGLFILIGIAVNNGIILVDKSLQLRAQGMTLQESLCESGRQRLRPILMTASTTVLGLVPMLVYHPTLAGIYYHSIAIIVAAGLVSSTLVTLVFLPAAYVVVDQHARAARAMWRRFR